MPFLCSSNSSQTGRGTRADAKSPSVDALSRSRRQVTDPPFTSALHINRAALEKNMSSPSTPVTSLRAFYRTVWIVQTAGIWLRDQWCETPDFLSAVGCCGDEMEHQSNEKDPLAADESQALSRHVHSVGEF